MTGSPGAMVPPAAPSVAGTTGLAAPGLASGAPAEANPTQALVSVLSPVLTSADGTHQISLMLQPEGLGRLHALVMVSAGHTTVQLMAETAQARHLLYNSMADLREQLSTGSQLATVVLSESYSQTSQSRQGPPQPWTGPGSAPGTGGIEADEAASVPVGVRVGVGGVDLRL